MDSDWSRPKHGLYSEMKIGPGSRRWIGGKIGQLAADPLVLVSVQAERASRGCVCAAGEGKRAITAVPGDVLQRAQQRQAGRGSAFVRALPDGAPAPAEGSAGGGEAAAALAAGMCWPLGPGAAAGGGGAADGQQQQQQQAAARLDGLAGPAAARPRNDSGQSEDEMRL